MTIPKLALALMALTGLTACDYVQDRQDLAREREDGAYRAALADYRAGRLDAAAKGFAKAIRKAPDNSAARFQYACLMQDAQRDYLEAFCAYREFLMQRPDSDKASLARDRLAICERELARELAEKHRLLNDGPSKAEISALRKDLKTVETRAATAERLLAEEREKFHALENEHARLVAAVKGKSEGERTGQRTAVDVKDLLDEEDEEASGHAATGKEVLALKAEESEETSEGPSLLPKQTPEDVARRAAAQAVRDEEARAAAERAADEKARRPSTYVVQEGDTLYKIALRFYGHVSAWRRIRDVNKALISNDGRIRAGQTIALP